VLEPGHPSALEVSQFQASRAYAWQEAVYTSKTALLDVVNKGYKRTFTPLMSLKSERGEDAKNGSHWNSKVECLIARSPTALAKGINDF
jgi:hypothetical protein